MKVKKSSRSAKFRLLPRRCSILRTHRDSPWDFISFWIILMNERGHSLVFIFLPFFLIWHSFEILSKQLRSYFQSRRGQMKAFRRLGLQYNFFLVQQTLLLKFEFTFSLVLLTTCTQEEKKRQNFFVMSGSVEATGKVMSRWWEAAVLESSSSCWLQE